MVNDTIIFKINTAKGEILQKGSWAVYTPNVPFDKYHGKVCRDHVGMKCPMGALDELRHHENKGKIWCASRPNGIMIGHYKTRQLAAEALVDYHVFREYNSNEMWDKISSSPESEVLYIMGCKLQELEHMIEVLNDKIAQAEKIIPVVL